jgi:hypothetical protein
MGGTPWQYRLRDTPSSHIATSPEARFPAGFAESPTKQGFPWIYCLPVATIEMSTTSPRHASSPSQVVGVMDLVGGANGGLNR